MGKLKIYRALIDTNVLINDVLYRRFGRQSGRVASLAIDKLRQHRAMQTHVASIALLQLHSTLSRAKVANAIIEEEIRQIVTKHVVVSFTETDIVDALNMGAKDIEDAMQYALALKSKCRYIITANTKDFADFGLIVAIPPKAVNTL